MTGGPIGYPLDQSVNYWYKNMRFCTKVIYFLKSSNMALSEKKIKDGCPFAYGIRDQELKVRWFLKILMKLTIFDLIRMKEHNLHIFVRNIHLLLLVYVAVARLISQGCQVDWWCCCCYWWWWWLSLEENGNGSFRKVNIEPFI
jgi:hypothetical protein